MKASDIPTAKWSEVWGKNTPGSNIRAIPLTTPTAGFASQDQGFPPLNAVPTGAGGIPPFIQDMNGALQFCSGWALWLTAGGGFLPYDATFQALIGGYPKGNIVESVVTTGKFFLCTADDNTTDPDSGGSTNWSVFWLPRKQSTFKQLLSGSGTVTPSAGVVRWRVRMVAGGGGGATQGFSGGNGVVTSLRDWTVNPGAGGIAQGAGGAGGTGGTNGTGSLVMRQAGAQGQNGPTNYSTGTGISNTIYTLGGSTALGGAGTVPAPNSGAGGTSSFLLDNTHNGTGGGGGGEFVEFVMDNPAAAGYTFAVGAGGTLGASPATAGATGAIYIEELYS